MARGDGIDRTNARNMRLTATKIGNTQQHNEREKDSYVNQDIVPERTPLNIHFKTPSAGYQEMFAQMEADGVISTRGIKADAFRYGELVFDVNSAYFYNHGGYDFAKQFYTDAYKSAIEIVGGEQYILSAVMHADERNRAMSEALGEDVYHYHLHVVYVPVVQKEVRWTKRCKDKSLVGKVKETIMQVSMSKKWASKPAVDDVTGEPLLTAKGKPVLRKSYSVLQDDFFRAMRNAGYDDLERGERGSSEEHLTVTQFKVERERERLAQLQAATVLAQAEAEKRKKEADAAEKKAAQAKAKLDDVAPLLKGMEKLAADYSDDPERTLPEAGPLESARAYREKKAKPLWEKIVKVLRSVYRAYFDLKSSFEQLQRAYDREVSKNSSLSARIYEVCAERDSLKGQVRDYERVRRAIGPEQADRILEVAHQQEQAEKERRRGTRQKARSGAR
ncbi:recombinase [Pseudoflavonifractor sp. 60]|uniref:plasmid recombination protein n=1 Tax=Pseudoflavonifractor sp. 60 TaxID=2304576 RepID=UPI001368A969|nr:plasmid recombination protein [Pseudoflavonifractor sp. 60]NBI68151.1 recombinase [Pseudoflavonifractor sp. 60]